MRKSSLEITDQEYLIKLSKNDFDLTFINQLLKRIQQQSWFSDKNQKDDEDIISRQFNDNSLRFDSLHEK